MFYTKRFGAFIPIISFVASLLVSYLVQPRLEKWSPVGWRIEIVFVGVSLWAAIFYLVRGLNFAVIRYAAKSDLWPVLKTRWHYVLNSTNSGQLPVENYVDKVADLQIRVSTPTLVRDVVSEILADQKAVCASLQKTIDHYADNNELRAIISALGNNWRAPTDFVLQPPRLVDDPVHGCIALDDKLSTIVAQPIVQRIARIRQLSFSYTHFPSATHSRLSHVLGVAHNVERALSGIFSRGVYYQEGEAEPIDLPREILEKRDQIVQRGKLLAMLHDLGHGPFGHALDNYVGYINKHESAASPDKVYSRMYVERYLSTVLKRLDFDPAELVPVLSSERDTLKDFDALIGDLIDSSMDMDRMDYLIRDAHMTGLSMGFTNADALIQCVRPLKVSDAYILTYDERGVEYMEYLLYAREAMYRSCYEHPRKRAAERLFERLVREIAQDDPEIIDDLYLLTDEEVLCALRLVNLKSDNAKRLLEQLVANSDYFVIHDVVTNSPNLSEEARVWVKGATAGKGKGKQSYIDRPAEWEDAIARDSIGAERGFQILAIVAPPSAYQKKWDDAAILFRNSGAYRTKLFFEIASGVKEVLEKMNIARARIKVMCPNNLSWSEFESVKQASISQLGY